MYRSLARKFLASLNEMAPIFKFCEVLKEEADNNSLFFKMLASLSVTRNFWSWIFGLLHDKKYMIIVQLVKTQ